MREIIDWIAGVVLVFVVLFIFTIGCVPALVEEEIVSMGMLLKVFACGVLAFTWTVNCTDKEKVDDENDE